MTTESIAKPPWHRRPYFRLSLRGLIALVLLVGGGLGWLGYRARVQREVVERVERAGAKVTYDFQEPAVKSSPLWYRPKWLVDFLGVDSLAHVTSIQDYSLSPKPGGLTDDDLAAVGRLDRLETLTLWGSPAVTDAGLAHLRGLTRLHRLELGSGQEKISGASLADFSGLTQLEQFQFLCPRVTDADLAHLSGLIRLQSLRLSLDETSAVTDAGLAHLERLRDLESLGSDGARKITDAGLAHLGKLTGLEMLYLTNSPITTLKGLSPLVSLKLLTLMGTSIDDDGLAPVAGFSRLLDLNLVNARITDAGLAHLRGLPSLIDVNLTGTRVTDAGLATLGEFPKLVRVSLGFTQVGDAGLAALTKLKRLSTVDIMMTKVTPEGIDAAKAAHPGLRVITAPGVSSFQTKVY